MAINTASDNIWVVVTNYGHVLGVYENHGSARNVALATAEDMAKQTGRVRETGDVVTVAFPKAHAIRIVSHVVDRR